MMLVDQHAQVGDVFQGRDLSRVSGRPWRALPGAANDLGETAMHECVRWATRLRATAERQRHAPGSDGSVMSPDGSGVQAQQQQQQRQRRIGLGIPLTPTDSAANNAAPALRAPPAALATAPLHVLRRLVAIGCRRAQASITGVTPLHLAARAGLARMVRVLLLCDQPTLRLAAMYQRRFSRAAAQRLWRAPSGVMDKEHASPASPTSPQVPTPVTEGDASGKALPSLLAPGASTTVEPPPQVPQFSVALSAGIGDDGRGAS